MSIPVARGGAHLPLIGSANALTAPTTPAKRIAVVDREHVDPKLREAAEGMEAMFLDFLMQTMRKNVQKSDMDLENSGTQLFQGMMDAENAMRAARQGGVGLADQIIAYMVADQYNNQRGQEAPGGSHAGRPDKKFGNQ